MTHTGPSSEVVHLNNLGFEPPEARPQRLGLVWNPS